MSRLGEKIPAFIQLTTGVRGWVVGGPEALPAAKEEVGRRRQGLGEKEEMEPGRHWDYKILAYL